VNIGHYICIEDLSPFQIMPTWQSQRCTRVAPQRGASVIPKEKHMHTITTCVT